MPLPSSSLLAPHFTAAELGADQPTVTPDIAAHLTQTAQWLEAARGILGVPLVVTDGYRTPEHNAAVGGSPTSDHPRGLAADFEAEGLTPFQVYQRLQAADDAGALPAYDQLIYYALDNHIHVGLGEQMRGESLFRTTEGSYVALAGQWVTQLRGFL